MENIPAAILRFRYIVAIIIGGLSAFGFQPWGLWPISIACFTLLIWIIFNSSHKKQAFFSGWLFGLGHFCIGLQWIAVSFTYQAEMPAWLGYIGVLALSLYLAVYPAIAALCSHIAHKKLIKTTTVNWAYILIFAAFWIITEWLRSWVFTGYAWNPLGVLLMSDHLQIFAGPARIIGTYGLAAIVILIAAFPLCLFQKQWKTSIAIITGLASLALVSIFTTQFDLCGPPLAKDCSSHQLTIVQPNITQDDRYNPYKQDENISKITRLTVPDPDIKEPRLIFWSESAIPWHLESGYPHRYYQGQFGETAESSRKALASLLNKDDILIAGNDRLIFDDDRQLQAAYNSSVVMNARGELLGWYDKSHLVPYGEYLALRWLFEPLGLARLVPGDLDFWAGDGPKTLSLGEGRPDMGVQICYEIIFSGQVVDPDNRPDFIFNPSNDAWFGDIGPPQHLAQARLRAIEEGLPVLRSTPTGVSAIIDANGHIRQSIPLGKAGKIDGRLPMTGKPTLFSRFGNILPLSFALLLLLAGLFPVARARLRR